MPACERGGGGVAREECDATFSVGQNRQWPKAHALGITGEASLAAGRPTALDSSCPKARDMRQHALRQLACFATTAGARERRRQPVPGGQSPPNGDQSASAPRAPRRRLARASVAVMGHAPMMDDTIAPCGVRGCRGAEAVSCRPADMVRVGPSRGGGARARFQPGTSCPLLRVPPGRQVDRGRSDRTPCGSMRKHWICRKTSAGGRT